MEIITSSNFDSWLNTIKDKHTQPRLQNSQGATIMSEVTYSKFDASKYLTTEEDLRDYLDIALEDGDTATIQLVLRDIAKARGMSDLARKTNLNRESLYKSLSAQGNPSFASIMKIMSALDLKMTLAGQKN